MIVAGLASVIIGEVLIRTSTILRALVAALVQLKLNIETKFELQLVEVDSWK